MKTGDGQTDRQTDEGDGGEGWKERTSESVKKERKKKEKEKKAQSIKNLFSPSKKYTECIFGLVHSLIITVTPIQQPYRSSDQNEP